MLSQSFTSSEDVHFLSSQLFTFETDLRNQNISIEAIGDQIPASVMIQDLSIMENTYMNKKGCDILMHESEELRQLGAQYFEKFFVKEEVSFLKTELFKFILEEDYNRMYSFFQRVRPNDSSAYKWYLLSSRLCRPTDTNCLPNLMHIAVEVNELSVAGRRISNLFDQDNYTIKNYWKFNLLSKREKEIINLISLGYSSYTISERLFISIHTVNNHRKNILKKLEIDTLAQLIRFAIAFHLLEK